MTALREQLAAEFTGGEVQQFTGRAGRTFDYIEDETVMDRLDEVLGVGNWSVRVEPISVADGIVKVTLSATVDGLDAVYEDFGYSSNSGPQAETLKEAVSDGIRRCGRYLGVGRYLYRKHDSTPAQRPRSAPQPLRTVQTAPAPARSTTAVPEPPLDWAGIVDQPVAKPSVQPVPPMTTRELLSLAENNGLDKRLVTDTAKRLFGEDKWKLVDLSSDERHAIAVDLGLVQ